MQTAELKLPEYKVLGDKVESYYNYGGYDWRISTWKDNRKRIACNAQGGILIRTEKPDTGGGKLVTETYSCALFTDPSMELAVSDAGVRATEKALVEIHLQGLKALMERISKGDIPVRKVFEHGDVLQHTNGRKAVVVDTTLNHLGAQKAIQIEEPYHEIDVHAKGGFLNNGWSKSDEEQWDAERIEELATTARISRGLEQAAREEEMRKADEKTEKAVEALTAIKPAGVEYMIVARLKEDTSDPMTDYFAHRIGRVVLLCWSKSSRNDMAELKAAAKLFKDTEYLASEEYEERGNYSFALSERLHSGWEVTKVRAVASEAFADEDNITEAARNGNYAFSSSPATEGQAISGKDIELIEYSERSFVLTGEGTRAIKDELKSKGGGWNSHLSHSSKGGKFGGWVFPATKRDEVMQLLNKG